MHAVASRSCSHSFHPFSVARLLDNFHRFADITSMSTHTHTKYMHKKYILIPSQKYMHHKYRLNWMKIFIYEPNIEELRSWLIDEMNIFHRPRRIDIVCLRQCGRFSRTWIINDDGKALNAKRNVIAHTQHTIQAIPAHKTYSNSLEMRCALCDLHSGRWLYQEMC